MNPISDIYFETHYKNHPGLRPPLLEKEGSFTWDRPGRLRSAGVPACFWFLPPGVPRRRSLM